MDKLIQVGALSLGGVLGVNARFWLGLLINRWAGPQFPWATFVINVSGSFLIGFLTIALARWLPHPNLRLLVITGFLGGYTTFSTFAFESLSLWERGERRLSFGYMAGSVAAGFLAVALGAGLAQGVTVPSGERRATTNQEASVSDETNGQAEDAEAAREAERGAMIPADARLLRLYVNSDDRFEGRPLFEAVVTKARTMGMAGASAFPVEMSYGSHRWIHEQMSEYTFVEIPVVIEVVDAPERIDTFLAELRAMVREGLATVNPARVVRYVHEAHTNDHRG